MTPPDSEAGGGQLDSLIPRIYNELRELAASFLSREAHANSLRPTALVHEAYERLLGQRNLDPAQRSHFFAAAGTAMRRVLVDHARARRAVKRGGGAAPLTLDTGDLRESSSESQAVDADTLESALRRLEAKDPRAAHVVVLRFYAGLSFPEVALVLDLSERQAKADWTVARAFLHKELARAG